MAPAAISPGSAKSGGDLLSLFTTNVLELKSQGYYVPDVDFDYSVAGELNYVSTSFGYRDDIIESIMYSVQHVVDCQMNPASCK